MAKLEVDHARCIKSGECYLAQPQLFKEGSAGFPEVLNPEPSGADLTEAEAAAYACPGRAIRVWKESDGRPA